MGARVTLDLGGSQDAGTSAEENGHGMARVPLDLRGLQDAGSAEDQRCWLDSRICMDNLTSNAGVC